MAHLVNVRVSYIPTKQLRKNGKPKLMRIEHRKLFIDAPAVTDSGKYRIVYRSGRYTTSVAPRHQQSHWTNPTGRPEVWYTVPQADCPAELPYNRTADAAMDHAGIFRWLSCRVGETPARLALTDLLTAQPETEETEE